MTTGADKQFEKFLVARERMSTAIVKADELCRRALWSKTYPLHSSEQCKQASLDVVRLAAEYEKILDETEKIPFVTVKTTTNVTKN